MSEQRTTDFGYRQVPEEEKTRLVGGVFDSVATRYDLMNDLMSGGIHRIWKRVTIELSGVREGHRVLDVAGGTGDLSSRFARIVGPNGRVVLSDINAEMLVRGRDRMLDEGHSKRISCARINAEALPFPDDSFDLVTIAFGLRNVTDQPRALAEMCRVLRPGGRALVLEFSEVRQPLLKPVYDAYSFGVLPLLGKVVAKDEASYRYLAESIRKHPNQARLAELMSAAGLERVSVRNLLGGIVAIHSGYAI